jgi:glycosyltransferase involved in cell wall biosynthesis
MKILYLITRAEIGGAQIHLLDLLKGFRDSFELELGLGEPGFLADMAEKLGVRCHIVPDLVQPIHPVKDLRALHNLVKLVRTVKPDIVHAHTSKAGLLGRLAAQLNRVPSIFTAHTWAFVEGTSWKWKVVGIPSERLVGSRTRAIINVSHFNRELALRRRIAAANRLVTIHNGIPDTPLRATPGTDGVVRIVMVARFAPQKNQILLLRAAQRLDCPVRITFVGDGHTRPAVQEVASNLGPNVSVEFLGERRDIDVILAESHIFALSTNWEGFPLTILEAMRAGLPVISCDVGGVNEAVCDGRTGFLVPAGDEDLFAERLAQLVADSRLREEMGLAARARYEEEFTLAAMLRKTLQVYRFAVTDSLAPAPSLEQSKAAQSIS